MKVLVGVCGIGRGHCSRQYKIINELIKKGHEVRVFTYNDGIDFFKKTNIITYRVFVPIVMFKHNRIDFVNYIKKNSNYLVHGYFLNKKTFKELIKEKFIPNVCISDYEPTTAKFAYKLNIPLINIDQQSKFIYMDSEELNGCSISEEKKRMKLFFPKFDKKLIISFYKINNKNLPDNVKLLTPFIRDEIKSNNQKEKEKIIIVYFSKFIDIPIKQELPEIFEIFNKFTDYKFIIYVSDKQNCSSKAYDNIEIKKNDKDSFAKDFGKACCAISTAGHTLISEAIYCNIPTFVIPLPTFDQNYCAKFIRENKIGYSSETITFNNLKGFINNIEQYTKNINECNNIMRGNNSIEYIIKEIEKYGGNN